jgi:hypothetical protein
MFTTVYFIFPIFLIYSVMILPAFYDPMPHGTPNMERSSTATMITLNTGTLFLSAKAAT